MLQLLIWLCCFLWMTFLMTAKLLQLAVTHFSSIVTDILKSQQKIQDLSVTAEEWFKQSLVKNILKSHSKGKSKKRTMKDNRKCLNSVVKYDEGKSREGNCSTKEVPSNGLSDTSSIVPKSRPPDRVKKRSFVIGLAMTMTAFVTFFVHPCAGASAKSFRYTSLEFKAGQNVSMKIPEDIAVDHGDVPFFIRFTPNNNSSDVLMLCTYFNGVLSTTNQSYRQRISCRADSVFISSAKPHHAGTYSIILDCAGPGCPLTLTFNLSIIIGKDELLPHPNTAENKTDVGGVGSNSTNINWAAITIGALFAIVILAVAIIIIILHQRKKIPFPWKKSLPVKSSIAAENGPMITDNLKASSPTRAEEC